MNDKPLPVGVDNFEKLITRGYYYVDKTLLIKELLEKKGDVNLFIRPRRFGKTLNMSMLQYFFEDARGDGKREENRHLFDGLKIMGEGERYISHMGKYPVINLSLKSTKQPTFELAFMMLKRQIAIEYERHEFILENPGLGRRKERFERIMREKGEMGDYVDSLLFLSACLEKYYGRRVIILIDEYDVPLENAFMRGFYGEMADLIRSLFESALKTNDSLEFAVITGCLRVSKESIFTGFNNLEVISILSRHYGEYFGFTPKEVECICHDYQLGHKYELLREWYNGYVFGDENVYNPWSVIRYIKELKAGGDALPVSYWANTSGNDIVRELIERADDEAKGEIENLIDGGTIIKPVHEDITYDEVYQSMDNLWNFLFFTGYLRKVSENMDEEDKRYVELAIPNREVKYIFRTKILSWFQEEMGQKDLSSLYKAFQEKNVSVLEEEMNELLLQTISFYDAYENFYHGFLTGILAKMQGYRVLSNREGGKGRSDLFVKPITRRKAAFVVELKVAKAMKELKQKAEEALCQIEDRNYAKELQEDGYMEIVKYGIAFFGKDCMITMKE